MDTLHERLAELADDAPMGGAPAAELWARGRRAHRIRAAAVAIVVLLVGGVGTGLGVRVADGDGNRSVVTPVGSIGFTLPIQYPGVADLPDLGDAPGPLAGIWLVPGAGVDVPDAVGLVAETGRFGTLPIDVSEMYIDQPDAYFALSPDGRRIAYDTPANELVVRDLVSGESYSPEFPIKPRPERWYTWVDATHLVGHDVRGGEGQGWVWEPGKAVKVVDLMTYPGSPYLGPYAGRHPWFFTDSSDPRQCLALRDGRPVLCDVVGVIGPEIALTHDGDGAVVALDARGVEDPAQRQLVLIAGAPKRVVFATDLIGELLRQGVAS